MKRILHTALVLVLLLISTDCKAQSIYIVITESGSPTTYGPYDGPNISIPGTIPGLTEIGASVSRIRLYSTQNIGHVTLAASRSANNPLFVLIADPSLLDFPEDATTQIQNSSLGAANWGGITCSADCKSAVRVAAGVSGAITGPVDVGQVFRLQAGGAISGDVLASNADGMPAAGLAIAAISAASISGGVEATLGTIGNVATTSTSQGITGNILAPAGEIRSVLSGSEIGQQSSATPVRIEAKTGIGSIQAKAINADIKADVNNGTGNVRLVKASQSTTGHFKGSLRAKGIAGDASLDGIRIAGSQFGSIQIAGSIAAPIEIANYSFAPITVTGDVLRAGKISAKRFDEPITISGTLSSDIAANDVGANVVGIEELIVGNVVVPAGTSASDFPTVTIAATQGSNARRIGRIVVDGGISPNDAGGNCRIRCDRLDHLETGAVSGVGDALFYLSKSTNPLNTTPTSAGDAVVVGSVEVRGTYSGIMQIASFDSIECEDFAGEMMIWNSYGPPVFGFPQCRLSLGRNTTGGVVFQTPEGLKERLVMNRHGEEGGDFDGFITVKQSSGPEVGLDSSFAGAPSAPSSLLGGGSISLWPYQLYPVECYPSGFLLGGEQTYLTAGEFTAQTEAVHVRFTGPIYTTLLGQNPVQLEFIRYINGMTFNTRIDDGDFSATIPASPLDGSDREVLLVGDGSYRYAPGLYRVTLNPDVTDPVLCRGIVDAAGDPVAKPVAPFVYYFWLANDCDPCVCPGLCSVGDYDGNGGLDGGDLAAFFADYEAGLADVDMNGGVDGGDLMTFFCWFEQGGC